jgi:hypothetical protein
MTPTPPGAERNQCDGCRASMVLNAHGHHEFNGVVFMACTKDRYIPHPPGEIGELLRELDSLKAYFEAQPGQVGSSHWQSVVERAIAALSHPGEQQQLREALEKYGRHSDGCDLVVYRVSHNSGHPQRCTCGFERFAGGCP